MVRIDRAAPAGRYGPGDRPILTEAAAAEERRR